MERRSPKIDSPEADPIEEPSIGDLEFEIFGEEPSNYIKEPHTVFIMTPWGQPIWMQFSRDQWAMINQLAVIDNSSVETVVEDVAKDRIEAKIRELGLWPEEDF